MIAPTQLSKIESHSILIALCKQNTIPLTSTCKFYKFPTNDVTISIGRVVGKKFDRVNKIRALFKELGQDVQVTTIQEYKNILIFVASEMAMPLLVNKAFNILESSAPHSESSTIIWSEDKNYTSSYI
jgi:hypothetical protein